MTSPHSALYEKMVNPYLAQWALHRAKPQGEFHVILRLAQPKYPAYLQVTGERTPGEVEARVPCDQIARMSQDHNVLSIELCQHILH